MRILDDDGDTIVYEDDDGRTFIVHRSKRRTRSQGSGLLTSRPFLWLLLIAVLVAFCF